MSFTIRENEPLCTLTTWKTGGEAQFFGSVTTEAELVEAVLYARPRSLKLTVIGGGSNVLVSDTGVKGLLIQMAIKGIEAHEVGSEVFLTVGAGEVFDEVIAETVDRGYWGLENLSHIPGTVGATPVQNVGAYGVEVGSLISLVRVYDTVLETFSSMSASDCQFGYRDSIFKHREGERYVVTAVTYCLSKQANPQIVYRDLAERFNHLIPTQADIRAAVIDVRSKKFPDWHTVGTAGSFFKNPIVIRTEYEALQATYPELPMYEVDAAHVKVPLGWILDHILKLKGQGTATVGCFEGQALVLVNRGGANTSDVVSFANSIVNKVFEQTGITVEWEVRLLG